MGGPFDSGFLFLLCSDDEPLALVLFVTRAHPALFRDHATAGAMAGDRGLMRTIALRAQARWRPYWVGAAPHHASPRFPRASWPGRACPPRHRHRLRHGGDRVSCTAGFD